MKVELDTEAGIIEVGGIKISLELLQNLAKPNPYWLYSIVRNGEVVNIRRYDIQNRIADYTPRGFSDFD